MNLESNDEEGPLMGSLFLCSFWRRGYFYNITQRFTTKLKKLQQYL